MSTGPRQASRLGVGREQSLGVGRAGLAARTLSWEGLSAVGEPGAFTLLLSGECSGILPGPRQSAADSHFGSQCGADQVPGGCGANVVLTKSVLISALSVALDISC